jgi:hypothetical protein
MREIEDFSALHKADVGWTDIYCSSENPIPLSSLAISRSALLGAVTLFLPTFDRVLTGFGSVASECKHTIACGPSNSLALFAEFDDREFAKAVWFAFELQYSSEVDVALKLCPALAGWPVVIADWGWCVLLRPNDAEGIARYFAQRLEVFTQGSA